MPASTRPVVPAPVTLADVQSAVTRTGDVIRRTPLVRLPSEGQVYAKAENLQLTGSFKLRGAVNALRQLSADQLARGVVAHSSGNHAQGLACAASLLDVPATIVIPEGAPEVKVERTLEWGARVVRCGPSSEEREQVAASEAERGGLTLVPPYDHPHIIAGQGTAGLEILEQLPGVANILVPVGGGGLLAGVALAVKSVNPEVRVFGVEPELAADAAESYESGTAVRWESALTSRTVADGVRTQQLGATNLPLILEHVDGFLTATEQGILDAAAFYMLRARLVVEPTGALTLAALRELPPGDSRLADGPTVVIVSGGNIDPGRLAHLVSQA